MEKFAKLQTRPGAHAAAVVTGENYRITVLTERMLRLEYSEDNYFEDSATQVVLNREFPFCKYPWRFNPFSFLQRLISR